MGALWCIGGVLWTLERGDVGIYVVRGGGWL